VLLRQGDRDLVAGGALPGRLLRRGVNA
jgi:hypothetical protein